MPQSQSDMILDSITIDNIDEAMFFYSFILEKILKKKKRYQHNEDIMMNQLKNLDIKKEINRLKQLKQIQMNAQIQKVIKLNASKVII